MSGDEASQAGQAASGAGRERSALHGRCFPPEGLGLDAKGAARPQTGTQRSQPEAAIASSREGSSPHGEDRLPSTSTEAWLREAAQHPMRPSRAHSGAAGRATAIDKRCKIR